MYFVFILLSFVSGYLIVNTLMRLCTVEKNKNKNINNNPHFPRN